MSLWGHLLLTVTLLDVCIVYGRPAVGNLRNMDSLIRAVQEVEESNRGLPPLALVRALRRIAGHDDALTVHFLGSSHVFTAAAGLETAILNASSFSFFDKALHHIVTDGGEERGVVLAPDGSTLALGPLMLGIEAGLSAQAEGTSADGLFPLTLGRTLGLSFLSLQDLPPSYRLGPNGCWDNIEYPKVFKLNRPATLATDAVISGGMDGVILGTHLVNLPKSESVPPLSEILKGYYMFDLKDGLGLDELSGKISPKRTELSRLILAPLDLQKEVMETLRLVWKLERTEWIAFDTAISQAVKEGLKEFAHKYWDCPQFISRCQWGAKPRAGTPSSLSLPLDHLFVHHTVTPSTPCLSFPDCARGMRAMQRFHQAERGWNDIGYSFVVGSDGYVYEGVGWGTVGTHTRGQNSVGYGVSFIGNFSSALPSRHTLDLLRRRLVPCAVGGGRLVSNFTLKGHRQVVNYTSCPGDALFSEISQWENFRE